MQWGPSKQSKKKKKKDGKQQFCVRVKNSTGKSILCCLLMSSITSWPFPSLVIFGSTQYTVKTPGFATNTHNSYWAFTLNRMKQHFVQDLYGYTTKTCNVNVVFKRSIQKRIYWNVGWTIVSNESHLVRGHLLPMWTSTRYEVCITGRGLARPCRGRMHRGHLSFRSHGQSVQCPV